MPLKPQAKPAPRTDPEWSALTDEELQGMTGQRASSERDARQASKDLNEKLKRAANYRIGVNLFDLSRMEPLMRGKLLMGKLDTTTPVVFNKEHPDETGLVFICPLLQAATCCDIIRSEDRRFDRSPTRVYRCVNEVWTRLAMNTALTRVVSGIVVLSDVLFIAAIKPAELKGIEVSPIEW